MRFPNTGSVFRDLSTQMTQFVAVLCSQRGKVVAALLGAGQSDPAMLTAFRERLLRPRREEAYRTYAGALSAANYLPTSILISCSTLSMAQFTCAF